MAYRVILGKRISSFVSFLNITLTASDVGAVGVSSVVEFSERLRAPNYVMGNGGGTAGQVVRFSVNISALALATPDTPSNTDNIVGFLLADVLSAVTASILEQGRYSGTFTALTAGKQWLGATSLPQSSPPYVSAGTVDQALGFAPHSSTIHFRVGERSIN